MKRSTSLAAADVNVQIKGILGEPRRSKMASKTPPPIRKSSSPILTSKNVPLHRKMHNFNILKKRNSVKRAVLAQDAETQTCEPVATEPGSPSKISSFLHGKEQAVVKSPSRLISSGDDEDESRCPPVAEMADKRACDRSKATTVDRQTQSPPGSGSSMDDLPSDDRSTAERRDSGLSGCSCSTLGSAATSNPATPIHVDRVGAGTRFSYPAATSSGSSSAESSLDKRKSTSSSNVSFLFRCLQPCLRNLNLEPSEKWLAVMFVVTSALPHATQ